MHFPLDFNGLHHLPTVTFQAAIEIVQVNATHPPGGPVVKLGGDGFAERVVPLFLPSADQIQTAVQQLLAHGGQLLGVVLQIGIHGEHHAALRRFKPFLKGRAFSVVPGESNSLDYFRRGAMQAFNDVPGFVAAAVVHEDDLVAQPCHGLPNALPQFLQAVLFVQQRDHHRHVQAGLVMGHAHANSVLGARFMMAADMPKLSIISRLWSIDKSTSN